MTTGQTCWWCKKATTENAAGVCDGCLSALEGVTLVPNSTTDAELIASLREQVRTLTEQLTASEERGSMILDAKNDMLDSVRSQVRTLTTERDASRAEARLAVQLRIQKEREATQAQGALDALRARVAELEASLRETIANANRLEKQRAEEMLAALRERDSTRDAALEEAGQHLFRRSAEIRAEAEKTAPDLAALKDARTLVAGERLNMGHELLALKTQPARRFVEAERVRQALARISSAYGESSAIDEAYSIAGLDPGEVAP